MNREDWNLVLRMESDPTVVRTNEMHEAGPDGKLQVFATRFFRYKDGEWRELAYYIPMLQPEGSLQVFKEPRMWSEQSLMRVGLSNANSQGLNTYGV